MSREFGRGIALVGDLAKALKIDRPLLSIKIEANCAAPRPAKIMIEFHASPEDNQAIARVIETYHLASARSERGLDRE